MCMYGSAETADRLTDEGKDMIMVFLIYDTNRDYIK